MKPYIPIYKRSPNKFVEYQDRLFDDEYGHTGTIRIAIFKDKNNKTQEMVAQVKWRQ